MIYSKLTVDPSIVRLQVVLNEILCILRLATVAGGGLLRDTPFPAPGYMTHGRCFVTLQPRVALLHPSNPSLLVVNPREHKRRHHIDVGTYS